MLTEAMKNEYQTLWDSCVIKPNWKHTAEVTFHAIWSNIDKYKEVAKHFGNIPPVLIGAIHSLEASLNFHCHLSNGDPLSGKTTHVPWGRIPGKEPPYLWVDSAIDALQLEGAGHFDFSMIPVQLYFLEAYNGFGYRSHGINSPYLYSGTNHYVKGKYTSDGHYDSEAVSNQLGAVAILREYKWYHENQPAIYGT